jgi:hypothetical protein
MSVTIEVLTLNYYFIYNIKNLESIDRIAIFNTIFGITLAIYFSSINNGYYRRPCNPFFIDPSIQKRNKKDNHHDQIKDEYKNWANLPIKTHVDLTTFDLNHIEIKIIGDKQILPIIDPNNKSLQSRKEMALSHLNHHTYKESYDNYRELLSLQKEFNLEITEFITTNREHLKKLVQSNQYQETEIEELLRLYLYTIANANRYQNKETMNYHLNRLESVKTDYYDIDSEGSNTELSNPFPEKESVIIEDIKYRSSLVFDSIKKFRETEKQINELIKAFQDSLQIIIDNDLKGECSIERKKSLKRKLIISFGIASRIFD